MKICKEELLEQVTFHASEINNYRNVYSDMSNRKDWHNPSSDPKFDELSKAVHEALRQSWKARLELAEYCAERLKG